MNDPVLVKVFLALRTNFVPDFKKEHVTLRYYNTIRWETLLRDAARLDKKLPATIMHKGQVHSWLSGKTRFRGFQVSSPDSTILDHLSMAHITVPQMYLDKLDVHSIESHQVVDTLWLGKSVKGQYLWTKVSNKPIGVNENGEPELDWSLTGLV